MKCLKTSCETVVEEWWLTIVERGGVQPLCGGCGETQTVWKRMNDQPWRTRRKREGGQPCWERRKLTNRAAEGGGTSLEKQAPTVFYKEETSQPRKMAREGDQPWFAKKKTYKNKLPDKKQIILQTARYNY